MPSRTVLCKDCERKKREVEENGAYEVVSCEPEPRERKRTDEGQRCRLVMRVRL